MTKFPRLGWLEFSSYQYLSSKVGEYSEKDIRIAALQMWSDLAKQNVFRNTINETLPALLDVENTSSSANSSKMHWPHYPKFLEKSSSQVFSEAFRHAVAEAAPDVMSEFGNTAWFTEAFGEIINSFSPKIMASLKDEDDDVRIKGLEIY
ncbi:hypothetical protein B0H14DRAFT_2588566 [Mycena olivaceomarginata]|nr:hypothetical protein B0H14DRAFT_2588566 [Mycena olivaceomarginata]